MPNVRATIRVKIPRVDRSVHKLGESLRDVTTAEQILAECLVDLDATPALTAIRPDLPTSVVTLWADVTKLAQLAERDGLEDPASAAAALLHRRARMTVDPSDPATALPDPPPPAEPEVPEWCITVLVPSGRQEVLRWPIVAESEKAVRVATPGGEIWLPRHVVTPRMIYGPNYVTALVGVIRDLSAGEELVQLFAAKEVKPGRWRASIRTVVPRRTDSMHDRKRQIWLNAAHVVKVGRHAYAARWVVTRALEDSRAYMSNASPKSLRFAPDERILDGKGWAGLAQIERSITEVLERLTRG